MRFAAQAAVAYLWAELFNSAIPQEEVYGINFRYLLILVPAVIALGKNSIRKGKKVHFIIITRVFLSRVCYKSVISNDNILRSQYVTYVIG